MDRSSLKPLQRILIPSDGSPFSEQALPYARAIGGVDAEFVLVQVTPRAEALYGLLGNRLLSAEQVRDATREGASKDLAEARNTWIPDAPKVVYEVATGGYPEEILAAAERHDADLIVMATHGRGAVDRWVIGSVADRIARTSPVPVMLVHPVDEEPRQPVRPDFQRLIIPLDGSELANQALPFAARIARQHGIPVLLVTVSDVPRQLATVTAFGAAFSARVYEELLAEGRAEAERVLAHGASVLSDMGVTASQQVLDGQVAKAIASQAGENDLIVMTSHGYGGLKRWLLGSVATKLIHHPELAFVLVPASDSEARADEVGSS